MNHNEKKRPRDNDRFVSTMTFAQMGPTCDCDECGLSCEMPKEISNAVEEHKRQTMLYNLPSLISQERFLTYRFEGFSIWKLVLPPGAQPLTEYGNSHRFVLVDSMPKDRIVKSIGKGIIGSSSEESTRSKENWIENHGYFYKSNGGKAIGWVNDKLPDDKDLNIGDTSNDVVLYIIKATDEMLDQGKEKGNDCEHQSQISNSATIPTWVHDILKLMATYVCKQACDEKKDKNEAQTNSSSANNIGKRIALEEVKALRQLIGPLIQETIDPSATY